MYTVTDIESPDEIRTRPRPDCPLCSGPGRALYEGLDDVPSGAPGRWGFRECADPACRLLWIAPAPSAEAFPKASRVHSPPSRPRRAGRLVEAVRGGSLRAGLGHTQGVGPAWYRWLAPL